MHTGGNEMESLNWKVSDTPDYTCRFIDSVMHVKLHESSVK